MAHVLELLLERLPADLDAASRQAVVGPLLQLDVHRGVERACRPDTEVGGGGGEQWARPARSDANFAVSPDSQDPRS